MGGLVNLIGGTKGAELSCFTFSHILAATDNFSEKKLVGNGGFGYVYKVIFISRQPIVWYMFLNCLSIAPRSKEHLEMHSPLGMGYSS